MSIELPSFEEAVYLFEQWGFYVEPGPRPDEVTLILEGGDFRTYVVYAVSLLPQIANLILQTRWQTIERRLDRVASVEQLSNASSPN